MTAELNPIPVGANERDPSTFEIETTEDRMTMETRVRVRPPIVPDAYLTVTDSYLIHGGREAMEQAVAEGVRASQDEALRRFRLDDRVREIQQQADARVREARSKLIAELRERLAFTISGDDNRREIRDALQDAEAAS